MKKFLKIALVVPFILIGCGSGDNNATFESPNNVPVIENLSLTTSNNQSITIALDSIDKDGDSVSYEIVTSPSNGVAIFINNSLTYTPTTNYAGIERFTYRAYDGSDYSEVKEVLIVVNINIHNTIPTISDLSTSINKNSVYIEALNATDVDGDSLSYSIISSPSNGSVSFSNNILTYTPNTDYFGSDSFTYVANDGIIDSNVATASITIDNVNNAPTIYPSAIPEATEGTSYNYTIPVSDPDGDSYSLNIVCSDSLGNALACPTWLSIDNATGTISSAEVGIGSAAIVYLNVTATDSFGAVNNLIKELNIVDYSAFVLTWNTENLGDSDNNSIGFYVELNPNNIIDWGDGNTEVDGNNGVKTHTYSVPGTYSVSIIGAKAFEAYGSKGGPRDNTKIVSIDNWGSSKWINMRYMFRGAYNMVSNAVDIPDVSNVSDMAYAFDSCWLYNQPMNDWQVANVTNMDHTFSSALSFNQPLDRWDVGNVKNMYYMFNDTLFNQDISGWDVSQVTNFGAMFNSTPFNQDISSWNVSNSTNFASMFSWSSFNYDISGWDVSKATSLSHMFYFAQQFNQDLSSWNISNTTNIHNMFYRSAFNYPVDSWDVSNVVLFEGVFRESPFNQSLASWDVSNGTDFDYMFYNNDAFDQDLSSWTPISAITMNGFLNYADTFSTANYDLLLNAWAGLALQSNVVFGANITNYTTATSDAARTSIITNFTWTITDAGGI